MSMVHSDLGASSASRWIACPGSNNLCAKMPKEESSSYAEEGTNAHELAEICLKEGVWADSFVGEEVGESKFEVDEEMAEAVNVYLVEVMKIEGDLKVEQKFNLNFLMEGMFGTNDASVYDKHSQTLHVFDYKHGRGVAVEATRNPQLMYYALGAARDIINEHGPKAIRTVRLVIVQPRAQHSLGPVREDIIMFEELTSWAVMVLLPAARATQDENAPLVPGPKQCQWCRAKATCPALVAQALEIAKVDFTKPVFRDPSELSPEDLVKLLVFSEGFSGYADAVKAYAQNRAEAGMIIPGHKLVKGRTLRKWDPESGYEEAIKAAIGEAAFEKKFKSPAQIEKAMKARGLSPCLDSWTFKPEGKLMLVPDTDKRGEVLAVPAIDFMDVFN